MILFVYCELYKIEWRYTCTQTHTQTLPSAMSSIYFCELVVYCMPGIINLTPHLHVSHNSFFPLLICLSGLPWKRFKETALNCLVHKEKQMLPWETKENLAHPSHSAISPLQRGGRINLVWCLSWKLSRVRRRFFSDSAFHVIVQLTCLHN